MIYIFLGLCLAKAQEPDDIPQGAILITPNGPSQINAFSFPRDKDWFKFYAEQNVTYQIFTRPKNLNYPYDVPDTVMYLFSDPAKDHIAHNDDFKNDGTSLIEWLCPTSGIYFIMIQAFDSVRYGNQEFYSIQITSLDLQDPQTIISDVPDYSQSDFGDPGNCGPVAAACVLGYWDDHDFDLLVDSDPEKIEDVTNLVHELQDAMDYPTKGSLGGVKDENMPLGIELVCNTSKYDNNYDFKANLIYTRNFLKIVDEIKNNRPVLYGVIGHSIWEEHWMVIVGYLETSTTRWTINHDTWSSTHRDIYVDWDEATDCIITIHPGKIDDPEPDTYGPDYNNQYISTSGYGLIPFSGIYDLPAIMWFSPLGTGYSSQYGWGGIGNTMWTGNPVGSGYTRVMAGDVITEPFSAYGYNYNSNGFNNYYTGGFNNIISNPPQQTYFGSGLGFYPSINMPYQSPGTFFNNPFISSPQMLIPYSGLLLNPMFSPFPSLSPGPFLFALPF